MIWPVWLNGLVFGYQLSGCEFKSSCSHFGGNINVKVNLSNYATKSDLENVIHVDISNFALKRKFSWFKN